MAFPVSPHHAFVQARILTSIDRHPRIARTSPIGILESGAPLECSAGELITSSWRPILRRGFLCG